MTALALRRSISASCSASTSRSSGSAPNGNVRPSPDFVVFEPIELAAALAHEQFHVEHGPDEGSAYDRQLEVLRQLGADQRLIGEVEQAKTKHRMREERWARISVRRPGAAGEVARAARGACHRTRAPARRTRPVVTYVTCEQQQLARVVHRGVTAGARCWPASASA